MTDQLSEFTSGVSDFGSSVGSGVSGALDSVGNMFGGGGSTGLPGGASTAGDAFSTGASTIAQGSTQLPNISGGASPAAFAAGGPTENIDPGAGSGLAPPAAASGVTTTPQAVDQSLPSVLNNESPLAAVGPLSNPTPAIPSGGNGGLFGNNLLTPKNLLGGGALTYALINGLQGNPNQKALSQLAGQDQMNSKVFGNLASTAINGQLPGPAQTALNQALQAAQAQIRSKYASLGLSGSTAEAEDLANAKMASVAQQFQIGQSMAQTGLNEVNTSNSQEGQLYEELLKNETAQGTELGSILAKFAGAAVGGPSASAGG